jgi:hypothetical protein
MPQIQVGGHKKNSNKLFADVDDEDYDKVSKYKWTINDTSNALTNYAYSRTGGKKVILHRLIMGLGDYKDDKRIINHIDGNGLNCKKDNLEICDQLYNLQSFRTRNKKCGFIQYADETIDPNRKKRFHAEIKINTKRYRRRFTTEEEAQAFLDELVEKAKKGELETTPSTISIQT